MSPEGSSGLSGRDLKSSFGDEPLGWLVELLGLWLLDHTSGTPPVLALSDVSSLHGRGEEARWLSVCGRHGEWLSVSEGVSPKASR